MKLSLKLRRAFGLVAVIALIFEIKGFAAAPPINFDQRQGTPGSSLDIKDAEKTNPAPAAQPTPAAPKSQVKKSGVPALAANTVTGAVLVTGSGDVEPPCMGNEPFPESQSASVSLSGTAKVSNSNGVHGTIDVFGTMSMSGFCDNGDSGVLTGDTKIKGEGPVYDSKGNKVGTAKISGDVSSSAIVSGDSISVSENVKVSGSY